MVARFLYRLVSVVFFLLAIACWFAGAAGIAAQLTAQGSYLAALGISIAMPIAAFASHQASNEAWRSARYHHPRYDF